MNVVILMAGDSAEFLKSGYAYPKYLLDYNGEPIVQRIADSVSGGGASQISFVIQKDDDEKFYLASTLQILVPDAKIYKVNKLTKGATCSALYAIDDINNEEELVILNGDQLIKSGFNDAISDFRRRNLDGGIVCFRSVHPRWSYVAVGEDGFVNETSEKRPISNLATAGCYYFKHGRLFVEAAFDNIRKDVNYQGRYYVCSTYNELILRQQKVGVYEIAKSEYVSFATPQMYENYLNNRV